MVGGGLIGSAGGGSVAKAMRRAQDHMKGDERILGDGEFAQFVLDEARERLEALPALSPRRRLRQNNDSSII